MRGSDNDATVNLAQCVDATIKENGGLFIGLIEPSADNKVLCETLLHGLQDISAQYPQNLQVVVKGN